MLSLAITTALLSAFLDNVTTILLVVPITFLLADALDIDPVPLIVVEIVASNLGGTATLIGDPPNILIAGHTGLSFGAVHRQPRADRGAHAGGGDPGPVPRLPLAPAGRAEGAGARAGARRRRSRSRTREARRTVPILLATILAFFVHKPLGLEPATVALAGASVILLVTRQSLHDTIASIEWLTLFFLIGLFVMVGALEETGALAEVAEAIALGHRRRPDRGAALDPLGRRRSAPGVVDNIPFTAAMIPVVDSLGRRRRVLVGAVARRLLRRQRHDHRRGLQRHRLRDVRARRAPDRLRRLPAHRHPGHVVSVAMCTVYVMLRYA